MSSSRLGQARVEFLMAPGPEPLARGRQALETLEAELPADHPDVAEACTTVGGMFFHLGQFDQAEPYLRRAMSIYKDPARATPWDRARAQLRLGQCLMALERLTDAESLLAQSVDTLNSANAPPRLRAEARAALAELYEHQNRPDDAKRVRQADDAAER